jgi:energy-coupling factor transporter ATP-binding protein EcfA2
MAFVHDVLAWSKSTPNWQQDALRRLFQSERLTGTDLDEIYSLLKLEHGVNQDEIHTAIPLSSDHLPAEHPGSGVQLLSMESLNNVNFFPDGRSLTFAPDHLTVIFGANGSGKSGYARILKQVCRARHREDVRPNAFVAAPGRQIPSATVSYSSDGVAQKHAWSPSANRDPLLGTVAVFDAACASDYIAREGETAFQPFGLSKLDRLASEVMPGLLERLNRDIAALPTNRSLFNGLVGRGKVGAFIQTLSKNSDPEAAKALGTMSPEEQRRIPELTAALAESNPEPKALALDRLAARLGAIVPLAQRAKSYTTDASIARLKGLIEAARDSETACENAERLLRGEELLPGTGNKAWKELFIAAQEFSLKHAYPNQAFPHVGEEARCVLCQSELTLTSAERLEAFGQYIVGNAAVAATNAKNAVDEAMSKIRAADMSLGIDPPLLDEIGEKYPPLKEALILARETWTSRQAWMLADPHRHDWLDCPSSTEGIDIETMLTDRVEELKSEAKTLRDMLDASTRERLKNELAELTARQALVPLLPPLLQFIANAKEAAQLELCRPQLNTITVSRKASDLAKVHISDALVATMKKELRAIGYRRSVRHVVDRRTAVGRTMLRLTLEGTDVPVTQVLSEAEQRASALAFFLAELHHSGSSSALILDDPVSSMDHIHREKIAQRIAVEALSRQVIVFTHDAMFLAVLRHAAKAINCPIMAKSLEWDEGGPGAVLEGLPWDHMSVPQRIAELDQTRAALDKDWGDYPNERSKSRMAEAYSSIRGTLERLIRDEVLKGIFQPYSERVGVEELEAVVDFPRSDWDMLLQVYVRSCGALRGHDSSSEGQLELPDPTQLKADLAALTKLCVHAKSRRTLAEAARKARKH